MFTVILTESDVHALIQACRNSAETLTAVVDGMSDEPTGLIADPSGVKALLREHIARFEAAGDRLEAQTVCPDD